jgi:hypothetical protein
LEGSRGGRRPPGKPKNIREDEGQKNDAKSLGTKKWRRAARHRSNWKKKFGEVMDRRRAERTWEEEKEEEEELNKFKWYGFL